MQRNNVSTILRNKFVVVFCVLFLVFLVVYCLSLLFSANSSMLQRLNAKPALPPDSLLRYYYNIDTQRSQQEHPNMMHVGKAIVAKLEEHKARLKVISDIVVVVIVVVVILQQ
jgi:hypothetical protein